MTAALLRISIMLWTTMHIYIPFLPTPPAQMPVVTYYGPRVENKVNTSRFSYSVWMWCEGLQRNFYALTPGPIQWGDGKTFDTGANRILADVEDSLEDLAKQLMAKPVGKRMLFEMHCLDSSLSYGQAYDALLGNYLDGTKDAEGNYVLFTNNFLKDAKGNPVPRVQPYMGPWFEAGTKRSYDKWKFLMEGLKRHGATVDHVATENEMGFSYWHFGGNADWIAAIKGDPRFKEFSDKIGSTDITSFDHEHILKMNAEISRRVNAAYADGPYKAIKEVFPKASISDYNHFEITEPYHAFEFNGWELWKYTDGKQRNASQCSDMSGLHCAGLCARNGNEVTGPFPDTTWNGFLLSMNMARAQALSRPDLEFWPLIGQYSYLYSNPYYSDYVAHLYLLTGGRGGGIVLWNPEQPMPDSDYDKLLKPLTAADTYAGFLDRKTLETGLIDWQAKEIKTCSTANKRRVCFITPQTGASWWEVEGVRQ